MLLLEEKKITQSIITLGGKGTRLDSITKGIPKPLFPINGLSPLERAIKILSSQGITKYIFFINFMPDLFEKVSIELMDKYDIQIEHIKEKEPKGEAGSIFDCIDFLEEYFLFIHGDIIFDIDLKRFINFHFAKQSDLSIMTHLTSHPEDSDCIIESPSLSIADYKLKSFSSSNKSFYLGNAGVALVSKKVILSVKKGLDSRIKEFSFFRDIVIYSLKNKFKIFSYNTSEYLKDIGTPKRFESTVKDLHKNKVKNKSYRSSQKVLFLDRDQTLIKCPENSYILSKNNLEFYEKRIKKIAEISNKFDFALIITNQPQISMGMISWQEVIKINGFIINKCQLLGLEIAGFYLCPHHPHSGFPEEINILKSNCFCRKPLPGLFFEASYMRNISLNNSLFIGDSRRDFQAAKNAGMNYLSVEDLDFSS